MNLKNNTKVLATILVLLTTAVAIAKIPALITPREIKADEEASLPGIDPIELSPEDQSIIQEMYNVTHQLDSFTVITMEGSIVARDMADSSNNIRTTFIYSRSGNNCYYKWGSNEMISLEDIYINISHDTKQVFIAPPKRVQQPVQQPLADAVKFLGGERYKMVRESANGVVKISFSNPANASCRNYQLTYDSAGWITRSHMRLANEHNPADRNFDKVITYNLTHFEPGKARKELLQANHYLQIVDGVTIPVSSLKNYELIKDR